MDNIPQTIFLQVGENPGPDFGALTEVTWSDHKIGKTDIAYQLVRVKLNGWDWIVQSYSKGEFCNLATTDCDLSSIRINFETGEVGTWGKQTLGWKEFVAKIDIEDIKKQLELIFQ